MEYNSTEVEEILENMIKLLTDSYIKCNSLNQINKMLIILGCLKTITTLEKINPEAVKEKIKEIEGLLDLIQEKIKK